MTGPRVPADALTDILAEVWRPNAAPARALHVRPEVYVRLLRYMDDDDVSVLREYGCIVARRDYPNDVPVVIDGDLPPFPGFEVYRTIPQPREAADGRPH